MHTHCGIPRTLGDKHVLFSGQNLYDFLGVKKLLAKDIKTVRIIISFSYIYSGEGDKEDHGGKIKGEGFREWKEE
jgi:hypothetical protein